MHLLHSSIEINCLKEMWLIFMLSWGELAVFCKIHDPLKEHLRQFCKNANYPGS